MREVYAPQMSGQLPDDPQALPRWQWHEHVAYIFPRRWWRLRAATGMTERAADLLDGLISHMGWDNQVTDSLARVGRSIGMAPATVTRALRRLETARLVAVDRSTPTLLRLTVSPYLVWQGRPHKVYDARRAFDERCKQSPHHVPSGEEQHDHEPSALPALGLHPGAAALVPLAQG